MLIQAIREESRKIVLEKDAEILEPIDLSKSYNWYDLVIKITGIDSYEKRYAGRVETGAHSKSDPVMGGII